MKQILHIFQKDVRRLWPEILVSFAILIAFVKIYPQDWGIAGMNARYPTWLSTSVLILVPVSWWLLIARSIHGESLVGERQFWITRPYRWPRLMAAKALFVVVFAYLPFIAAQCALLRFGGFHPTLYGAGILYNLVFMTGIAILPLTALAAVTSSFGRMCVALLLVLVYLAGMVYVAMTLLPKSDASTIYGSEFAFGSTVGVLLTVIFLQFAQRRTALSRWLIVALALSIGLGVLFGPEDIPMRWVYPLATGNADVPLAFHRNGDTPKGSGLAFENEREVELEFPIDISPIASVNVVKADFAKARITMLTGEHWESHWQGIYLTWLPGGEHASVHLKVDRSFYERMKLQPMTLELSVALTTLGKGKSVRMKVPAKDSTIPGGGICVYDRDSWSKSLNCRFAMRQPPLMLATSVLSFEECEAGQTPVADADFSMDWLGTLDTDPAEFGLTPVWTRTLRLSEYSERRRGNEREYLCPGAELDFTPYTVISRRQVKVVVPELRMQDYFAVRPM